MIIYSQRMNDTPLRPWIIAEKGGKIISAHCDCMAGLGEACTHIAATLFWVGNRNHILDLDCNFVASNTFVLLPH
jgi:hypothetical protein